MHTHDPPSRLASSGGGKKELRFRMRDHWRWCVTSCWTNQITAIIESSPYSDLQEVSQILSDHFSIRFFQTGLVMPLWQSFPLRTMGLIPPSLGSKDLSISR